MKASLTYLVTTAFIMTIAASSQAGEILAAWDGWPDFSATSAPYTQADYLAKGISVSLSGKGNWLRGAKGSNDKTFGTKEGAAISSSARSGYIATKADTSENYLEFVLTNNRDAAIDLDSIHFDLQRQWGTAPRYYKLMSMGTGISRGLIIKNEYLPFKTPLDTDYADIDAPITLDDSQLAPGESAIFRLIISGGKGTTPMFIDNVAITEK